MGRATHRDGDKVRHPGKTGRRISMTRRKLFTCVSLLTLVSGVSFAAEQESQNRKITTHEKISDCGLELAEVGANECAVFWRGSLGGNYNPTHKTAPQSKTLEKIVGDVEMQVLGIKVNNEGIGLLDEVAKAGSLCDVPNRMHLEDSRPLWYLGSMVRKNPDHPWKFVKASGE